MRKAFNLLLLFFFLGCFTNAFGATSTNQEKLGDIPDIVHKQWTGDLDGMEKRRLIRILTVYSKTFYFLDKDTQRGAVYDVMKGFEKELNTKRQTGNIQVHVVFIPTTRDEIFKALNNGRGDIACANLTITEPRKALVDFTDPTFRNVSELVVTGPASPQISSLDDLSGNEVFVRKSSSYYESLVQLNEQFKKDSKKEIVLKVAPEELEDEDLLEMLNAGLVKIVVVDDHIGNFWKQIFPKITLHPDLNLRNDGNIAWAIRKDSPLLKQELNAFIKTHGKGTMFGNMTFQKYLKHTKFVKSAASDADRKKFLDLVQIFRKYSDQYKVDPLLMVAQGYQESQLNQGAKSHVGAVGIMQIMPATGQELSVGDINHIEPNIHAGVKYMRFMIDQFYKNEPMTDLDKALFTFASYNAGPGKIRVLRKEAAKRGLDPNKWSNNVEQIVSEKVGRETVTYVSNIFKYYIAYKLILEEQEQKEKIKKEMAQ